MRDMISRLPEALGRWMGGWQLLLLVLAIAVVTGGLIWEQRRHPLVPEGATQVESALNVDFRQTTFRYQGAREELLEFYRQTLPQQGWRYCGTQDTAGCTNLTVLNTRPGSEVEVYRRADDQARQGPTVEIWPIVTDDGRLYVTVYETRGE